jgi:cell division protein FtsQ
MRGLIRVLKATYIIFLTVLIYIGFDSFLAGFCGLNFFKIRGIEIVGCNFSNKDAIYKDFEEYKDKNIFDIDFKASNNFNNPWINRVDVKRIYPDRVKIKITEKIPVMKMKDFTGCYYLTDDFEKIRCVCEDIVVNIVDDIHMDTLSNFVKIYNVLNADHPKEIKLFKNIFKTSFDNYTILGSYDNSFLEDYKIFKSTISERYKNIESVDMRIEGKIFVKGVL